MSEIFFLCQSKISLLCKIKQYLPIETRKLYYNAYILPVMDYCLTVLGSASKYQLDRILAAKTVGKDNFRYASWCPYHATFSAGSMFMKDLNITEQLFYKSTHELSPFYICDLFKFHSSQICNVRSVSNNNMLIKRHNSNIFEKSLQYVGPRLWNSLPVTIRNSPSLPSFKTGISKFIISKRNT